MVDPITANAVLSAGSHGWNIAKGFVGAVETNSAVLAKFLTYAKSNGVFAAVPGPVSADSPALGCLYHTLVGPSDVCPFGNYVFYTERNMGKSSALRIFCSETLKKANRRSIYVSGRGSSLVYFENVAATLGVEYKSNWPKCLVAAMSCAPDEEPPVLVLDEFNDLGVNNENLKAMDFFMRECINKKLYLIIATSNEEVADELVYLNGWGKMKPLQAIHNGSVFESHVERDKPSWEALAWSIGQLRKVVEKHIKGDLGTFAFLQEGMNPYQAIQAAELYNQTQNKQLTLDDVSDEDEYTPTPL